MRNHDTKTRGLALVLAGLLGGACAAGDEEASLRAGAPDSGISGCALDSDCPGGLVCQNTTCVSPEDFLPPDIEDTSVVGRPAASATRLFTLAAEADALLVLDPATLDLDIVPVPRGPEHLAVVPGQEAALVLSGAARALTLVDLEGEPAVEVLRLDRRYGALTISPDGGWAVLWTPDGVTPDEGAEGLVAVVDIAALAAGAPVVTEVAAGFRHTDVHFVLRAGVATEVVVLGKGAATVVTLADLEARPDRLRLPETFSDVVGREVVAAPGASVLIMRGLATPALGLLDVDTSSVTTLALPGRATDIDLSPSGDRAVVAIRGAGQVALLPLPEVLSSSAAMRLLDVPELTPGQVEVAADGAHAAIFSAQDGSERFGWLDLSGGQLEVLDQIEKEVRSIALSPDGQSAIVIHLANPTSSVADDYERIVDQAQGYSLVDLASGAAQLKRTGAAPPLDVAFGASGRRAAVTVRDDDGGAHRIEAADLDRLIVTSFELASAPLFAGGLPMSERIWVTQVHPAGRISVLDMEQSSLRTLTGFRLNAEIVEGVQ